MADKALSCMYTDSYRYTCTYTFITQYLLTTHSYRGSTQIILFYKKSITNSCTKFSTNYHSKYKKLVSDYESNSL